MASDSKQGVGGRGNVCIKYIYIYILELIYYPFGPHTYTNRERRTTNYSKFVENVCIVMAVLVVILVPLPVVVDLPLDVVPTTN